ncbi:hypothetical protein M378DRAFT_166794 [Amanita muscaria Koide BX008]|uniref:Uncharacterized protein n=1 Tax=Amanita muscaria (strain Koide BX008) TaxID=946122 RepID=A0A0C2T4R9_AMAMK|nr:hypothetical protein M378DRAFT_166794 [Amanita muscaria Koide BX008]
MSYFLNKAGKDLFRKHIEQYTPPDPLYDYTVDSKGKKIRSKRAIPPGLSKRDAKILQSVQTRAHYLDKGFSVLGMRFGWAFIISLIPVAGAVADACLNYVLVIRRASEADIPPWLEARMLFNSAVSVGFSLIPIAGDICLAAWKANSRNAVLLMEFLRLRGEEALKRQEVVDDDVAGFPEPGGSRSGTRTTTGAIANTKKGWFAGWRGRRDNGKRPESNCDDNELIKAPPADEKGRFVERIPDDG